MGDLREQILSAKDIDEKTIRIPQWKAKVLVKGMSAKQRYRLFQVCTKSDDDEVDVEKMAIYTVIYCAHDPASGKPIFIEDDYDALSAKSGGAIDTITALANELSGVTEAAVKAAEKNS